MRLANYIAVKQREPLSRSDETGTRALKAFVKSRGQV